MLGLVGTSVRLVNRAPHGKSSRFHPDHFQVHGSVEVDEMVGLGGLVEGLYHGGP